MQPRSLAAVHYLFLLKTDEEDLQRLWSELTASAGADSGKVPDLGMAISAEEELQSFDLAGAPGAAPSRCRLVHRIESGRTGFSLCLLADMYVIEVSYWSQGRALAAEWQGAMEAIEADRDKLLSGVNGVFGETTLLAAPAGTATDEILEAASIASTQVLVTHLDPKVAGGESAALVHFPEQTSQGRDFYAIAADDVEAFTATMLPEVDSLIKKIRLTATYFGEQRQTIEGQRAEVDRAVGDLLHRQVVSANSASSEAEVLEKHIGNLSRLFGLLATDALLVRQSSERIARDVKMLGGELRRISGPGLSDEIGAYYINNFSLDLAEAESESRSLDFSRQNAQAAIEVVRTQVEILRAGEEAVIQEQSREILSRSLVLQRERLSLQVAAAFIEFVLVFYYVMKSWEGIAGVEVVEHISPLLRLLLIGSFSASAAIGTHFAAQALHRRSLRNRGLWICIAVLVSSLAAMVILSL